MATPVEAIVRGHSETLSREAVRGISSDLYQVGHDTLMGIDRFAKAYAEFAWAPKSSDGWIAITLEGTDNIFEVYHHPRWRVLSIDKVTVDPQTGRKSITDVEVCIANQTTSNGMFRNPYFKHEGIANTEQTERDFRDFLADIAKQTQPKV